MGSTVEPVTYEGEGGRVPKSSSQGLLSALSRTTLDLASVVPNRAMAQLFAIHI